MSSTHPSQVPSTPTGQPADPHGIPGHDFPTSPSLEELTIGFWERHGLKVAAAAVAIILAAGVAAFSQWQELKNREQARQALAIAVTPEELTAVVSKWPGSPEAALAMLQQASTFQIDGDLDAAGKALTDFIAAFPKHELVPGAWVSLGNLQEARDELDPALATYQKVSTQFADTYAAPLALISEARVYQLLKRKEDAKRVYESIITRFPLSVFATQAAQNLESM